jgi:hypothetical protein
MKTMIETKIIHVTADDFVMGKLIRYPGQDSLFLFDTGGMELRQLALNTPYDILTRVPLKDIAPLKQIDSLFFDAKESCLVIADSISKKLFKCSVTFSEDGQISLEVAESFPLQPSSIIVAAVMSDQEYYLLDKGTSMIRIFSKDLKQVKSLGSRMGYVMGFTDHGSQRLGFEFPEDIVVSQDGRLVVVSDSGNKRLVLISNDAQNNHWQLQKIITLPEFPFKILAWDETDERVYVSDFNCSIMTVSLRYGFVLMEQLQYPVDYFPAHYHYDADAGVAYTGSEKSNEIVRLTFPKTSLAAIAEVGKNYDVLMKIHVDGQRFEEARQMVRDHPGLLPVYMQYRPGGDADFDEQLNRYADALFQAVMTENKALSEEVAKLSHDFIIKYKSIPDSQDIEAANIDKENIRYRMFQKLKHYRERLNELVQLKQVVSQSRAVNDNLGKLLDNRFYELNKALPQRLQEIEANLTNYGELELLQSIVYYWLLAEEEQVVYIERGMKYEKPFDNKFLLAILNDFYYHVSLLFLKRIKIEQYISFADREITMYPDKMGIFKLFCNRLIGLKKYDDVQRMLAKFPDRDKEDINYFYYRIFQGKGETDKAFFHLKRELDLYKHRANLIPDLIALNKLNSKETQDFIDKILEGAGHAIDTYYHVAKAYFVQGNYHEAEHYVDLELESFPENKHAMLLKFDLFLFHSLGTKNMKYYEHSWKIFQSYIKFNKNEQLALKMFPFFLVLNYIAVDNYVIEEIINLKKIISNADYQEECTRYLSFLNYYLKIGTDRNKGVPIPKYEVEAYLSGYSTRKLAYDYFFAELKQMISGNSVQKEQSLQLVEQILKYNPGDEAVFAFLDSLT